jgi:hypothetical protein
MRSTFCLALPARTLTAGFPNLRCLARTTLAFRPPQTTDLAMRPWRCWPMPHLAVPLLVGPWGGGGRCCCRLSSVALPQCPLDPAAVGGSAAPGTCGLPVSTSRDPVHASGPSMSAGCADPGLEPNRCPEPDTAAGSRPMAAVHHGHGRSPEQGEDTAASPVADRPCMPTRQRQWAQAAACGSGTSTPPVAPNQGVRRAARRRGHCGRVRGALRNCGH